MALYNLADPATSLPGQLVLDSSLLLALRKGDDNPKAQAAHDFIRRLGQRIADRRTVAWLLLPVLQESLYNRGIWMLRMCGNPWKSAFVILSSLIIYCPRMP